MVHEDNVCVFLRSFFFWLESVAGGKLCTSVCLLVWCYCDDERRLRSRDCELRRRWCSLLEQPSRPDARRAARFAALMRTGTVAHAQVTYVLPPTVTI